MLSAVLFAQQVSRLAEVLVYTDLPFSVVAGIAVTLFPGVLSFTIPLATLAGIIIGFSRMGSDSEIVAMRSAGVGTWTMLWPVLLLGLIMTGATFFIQLKEVPQAARDLEKVALRGALAKLDSPVEPRTFSTLPRYVIYVRDGNKDLGTWGRVFIFSQRSDRNTEVYTARAGRIDSSGDQSELVLTDVLATRFPNSGTDAEGQPQTPVTDAPGVDPQNSYVVEHSDQLRFSINTGRSDIVQRLNDAVENVEILNGQHSVFHEPRQ